MLLLPAGLRIISESPADIRDKLPYPLELHPYHLEYLLLLEQTHNRLFHCEIYDLLTQQTLTFEHSPYQLVVYQRF